MSIGERLKEARKGLSQAEAAKRVEMTQQSWYAYEKGVSAPGAGLIKRVCKAFGVSADWLLELKEGEKDNAHARAYVCGREVECKECPYKRAYKKMVKIMNEKIEEK